MKLLLLLFIKIKELSEQNKLVFDVSAGGSIGMVTSIYKFWDLLTTPETLQHLFVGAVGTIINTVLGATVLLIFHWLVGRGRHNKKTS